MAGSITVSSITLDSDNNFSILSNTGATLFFANTSGVDIANSIGATAITNDKILSVANTKISGNIISSQIAPSVTLTTPIISGNLNLDSAGTTGIRVPTANTISFHTAGTEDVRIDANGNVGIGTVSPATRFDVRCVSDVTQDIAYFSRPDAAVRAKIALDGAGLINFGTSTNHPLAFLTNNAERMRINSAGQIAWGTSSIDGYLTLTWAGQTYVGFVMNNTDAVGTSANIRFKNNGTLVGEISSSTTVTNYVTSSDYRLKENVVPMTGALTKVAQLKPCTYTWKSTGEASQGFIAHELQAVVPDCVTGEKDAVETYIDEDGNEQTRIKPQGVDTSFLVATLTAAIQELKAINDTQAATITTLSSTITALTARIVALES